MSNRRRLAHSVFALLLFAAAGLAADTCRLVFANGLDDEIIAIGTVYSTPYDEPRRSTSRVSLAPGGDYRIGVQGTTLPLSIRIELVAATLVFDDLSGLDPTDDMALRVFLEDGRPFLARTDAEGRAEGEIRAYLTPENVANAVDKDFVMFPESIDYVAELVKSEVEDMLESDGELHIVEVEAGPIWNNDHARERCPEVARELTEQSEKLARWTGHWNTTRPGEMSVCACAVGTVGIEDTLFVEDEGGETLRVFPVFWMEWVGVGRAVNVPELDKPVVSIRLPVTGRDTPKMLEELTNDLIVDGFRPVKFTVEASHVDDDGDEDTFEDEIDFREDDDDVWDAQESIVATLTAAYQATRLRAGVAWIAEDAYDAYKAEEEGALDNVRAVVNFFSNGVIETLFIPDAGMVLH